MVALLLQSQGNNTVQNTWDPNLPRVNLKLVCVCVLMACICEILKGLRRLKEIWIGIE